MVDDLHHDLQVAHKYHFRGTPASSSELYETDSSAAQLHELTSRDKNEPSARLATRSSVTKDLLWSSNNRR